MGSGTTPPRALHGRYYRDGAQPWVKTLDLNNSLLIATDEQVTAAALDEVSLRVYPKGTVLIAMYGGFNQIGRTSILNMPACVNQAITAVIPDPKQLNGEYLLHALNHNVIYWRKVASSSRKDPNITRNDIREFEINLPSLHEQDSIARILSDTDALIEALNTLLMKKREIRSGIARELLSGSRRLPGFELPWPTVPLGDLYEFKNGLNKEKKFFGYGTPIINYMDVFSKPHISTDAVHGRVSVSGAEMMNYSARQGDAFFTRTSETVEEIGMASVLSDDISQAVFSGFVLRARPTSDLLDSAFAGYALRSEFVRRQIVATASYTTRALTNGRLLSQVEMPIPPAKEQIEIAQAIDEADAEIDSLMLRLAKMRQIKQAMAQELLSGRVRLA